MGLVQDEQVEEQDEEKPEEELKKQLQEKKYNPKVDSTMPRLFRKISHQEGPKFNRSQISSASQGT